MRIAKINKPSNNPKKPICQMDKEGNLIRIYDSIKEAKISTGFKGIDETLKGKYKTSGGYKWKYK